MCLIALAWRAHPRWRLVLIANRDERYDRPSSQAGRWTDAEHVIGGRDLEFGGTWLGVSEKGRLAAVTNFRSPGGASPELESRGLLASRYLKGELDLDGLRALDALSFRPFSLIAAEDGEGLFLTNRPPQSRTLEPGVHGFSNGPLDDVWPKTRRAVAGLSAWLAGEARDTGPLFDILADETPAPDEELPATGIGLERERQLSPCFLRGAVYGTRCSTLVLIRQDGRGALVERGFGPEGVPTGAARPEFRWPAY